MQNYQEKAERLEQILGQCMQVIMPVRDILGSIQFQKAGNKKERETDGFKIISGLIEMSDEILGSDVAKGLLASQDFSNGPNNGNPKKPDIPSSPLL